MRTEADQIEMVVVGFPVDQNQVRPDMAVAMIRPSAGEWVAGFVARQ